MTEGARPMSPSEPETVDQLRDRVRRWQIANEIDSDLARFEAAVRRDERQRVRETIFGLTHGQIDIDARPVSASGGAE
jgi:hypothetical protein